MLDMVGSVSDKSGVPGGDPGKAADGPALPIARPARLPSIPACGSLAAGPARLLSWFAPRPAGIELETCPIAGTSDIVGPASAANAAIAGASGEPACGPPTGPAPICPAVVLPSSLGPP